MDAIAETKTLTMASGVEAPPRSRRAINGWMLFDWAAQPFHTLLLTFVFARYFAQSVVPDGAAAQASWGYMLTIAGITIAILSPILGAIADATGPKKPWIAGFVLLGVLATAALWIAVPNADSSTVFLVLLAFGLGMIGFEFSAVFINALMPDLVPREQLGRLSGTSWAIGYVGGVVSLLVVLLLLAPFPGRETTVLGFAPLFGLGEIPGGPDRSTGPLTALWFAIFVVPFFLYTPDTPKKPKQPGAVKRALSELLGTIRNLPRTPSLFAYLGSSMFYRDALNGLYAFGGVYAGGVLQWGLVKLLVFGVLTAVTGAIGAWAGGRFDDRFGPKAVVTTAIVVLALVSVTIVSTDPSTVLFMPVTVDPDAFMSLPDIVFYICGSLIGAFGGALQAASRTLLTDQAEPGRMGEAFGLYALSGKATSFMAPALIALTTDWAAGAGFTSDIAQRIGISPIVLLFVIGLALLPFVKQRLVSNDGSAAFR